MNEQKQRLHTAVTTQHRSFAFESFTALRRNKQSIHYRQTAAALHTANAQHPTPKTVILADTLKIQQIQSERLPRI